MQRQVLCKCISIPTMAQTFLAQIQIKHKIFPYSKSNAFEIDLNGNFLIAVVMSYIRIYTSVNVLLLRFHTIPLNGIHQRQAEKNSTFCTEYTQTTINNAIKVSFLFHCFHSGEGFHYMTSSFAKESKLVIQFYKECFN